jgi:hypothetical protein
VAAEQSQRDRLLGRPRPSLPYRILVDPDGAERARAQLATVQVETRPVLLKAKEGTSAYRAAKKRRADAEAAVDDCYETIVLRALRPARFAEMEAEHPPTVEQMDQVKAEREQARQRGEELPGWPNYAEPFWPALLAESVHGDMTADDWATFLANHVSGGEVAGLRTALLNVNHMERAADPLVLPKGWTPTIS